MATAYDTANIIIPQGGGYKAGSLYGWNPQNSSLVDFSVTRAGATATRVNSSGLIESVAANVPRIDWAEGGSCPSLLVEPQRTNIQVYSEDFDNAAWSKSGVTVTANADTSPDGTANADRLVSSSGSSSFVFDFNTLTGGTQYTVSCYLRTDAGDSIRFYGGSLGIGASPDLSLTSEWQRFKYTFTASSSGSADIGFRSDVAGNDFDVYAWGFQLEEGAYASSYIPTTASSETRNADVIEKTSIASLLNDAEGTRYLEATVFDDSISNVIEISDATDPSLNAVLFDINGTAIKGEAISAGTSHAITGAAAVSGTYNKLAFVYATNNFSLHIDGSTAGTDTSGSSPTGLDQIRLTDGTNPFYGRIRVMAEYDYAQTATEANNLTT